MVSSWVQFAVCVSLVLTAGARLSRYGDAIGEKTGLSGTWIGLVLLATVTSLPELVTGVSGVVLANTPDIALGDALGSCIFNLLLLVLMDALLPGQSLFTRTSAGHILAGAFGIVMLGIIALGILVPLDPPGWRVGISSVGILVVYLVAMRLVFDYEQRQMAQAAIDDERDAVFRYEDLTLGQAVARYTAAAVVVVGAGTWLPFIGERLAHEMAWQQSFVGTQFIALATSTPELVVVVAAVRIGALDMAVSNLLGSNLFDALIIAIDDICYGRGPLLAHVSPAHAITAVSASTMTGLTIIGLLYRPKGQLFGRVGWIGASLVGVYLVNSWALFRLGG
jgi:cation:H+ antiporter